MWWLRDGNCEFTQAVEDLQQIEHTARQETKQMDLFACFEIPNDSLEPSTHSCSCQLRFRSPLKLKVLPRDTVPVATSSDQGVQVICRYQFEMAICEFLQLMAFPVSKFKGLKALFVQVEKDWIWPSWERFECFSVVSHSRTILRVSWALWSNISTIVILIT